MIKNLMKKHSTQTLVIWSLIILATFSITTFLPQDPSNFGIFSLLPALFLVLFIFVTKRMIEGLILASLVGIIMTTRPVTAGGENWLSNVIQKFSELLTNTMMDADIVWLIIVCGLMGSIIRLIEMSGGSIAFGNWISKRAKTQKSALIWTWLLGIFIFLDDYLSVLTLGSSMTAVTDKKRVPREFLAYIVDSTAAPVCVILPITTWTAFAGGLLEKNGWAPEGQGLIYFIKTIPFNIYAWLAILVPLLVILGIIPIFGPMKKAFDRVNNGGPIAPEGSEKYSLQNDEEVSQVTKNMKKRVFNLIGPIIVLMLSTFIMDMDMQLGVLLTLAFMFVSYLAQDLMSAQEFIDYSIEGFKTMIMPLLLMVLAFLFSAVTAEIYFTDYVIGSLTSFASPTILPLAVFIALSATEFITGSNWGMYIIALPIVIPLAMHTGTDVALCLGAVFSAGVFGSHICFYSDATVLTSAATGCENIQHCITQLPFGLLTASITAISYLIIGIL